VKSPLPLQAAQDERRDGAGAWTSPGGTELTAKFLAPMPITKDNLTVVVDAGWISKDNLCQGVENGPAPCN
jgi:D-xylose transport system substrate-binding protein